MKEKVMKIEDSSEWIPFDSLVNKNSIDLYEEALNDMLEEGEILPEEEFVSLARQAISNARKNLGEHQ